MSNQIPVGLIPRLLQAAVSRLEPEEGEFNVYHGTRTPRQKTVNWEHAGKIYLPMDMLVLGTEAEQRAALESAAREGGLLKSDQRVWQWTTTQHNGRERLVAAIPFWFDLGFEATAATAARVAYLSNLFGSDQP